MRPLVISSLALMLALGPGSAFAQDEARPTPTGAFEPAGKTKIGRFGHVAAALPDGRVLIIGGMADGGPTRHVEIWDPARARFKRTGRLMKGRMFAAAAVLSDGRVLVVGGEGRNGTMRSAEVWDPETGTFAPAGKLKKARYWMGTQAVSLPEGGVAVVGGGGDRISDTIETWDARRGTFRKSGTLPKKLWGHATTLLPDGRLLIVGGGSAAYLWDPSTGAVSDAGKMGKSRSHATATLLSDGRVLVTGGSTRGETVASAEIWDPTRNEFVATESMAEPRESHRASLLPDGRVLVVGGNDYEGMALATTEIWDPTTGQFMPSAPLRHGRAQHSVTLLPDGRVLVVGGSGSGPEPRDAELWDPSATYDAPAPPAMLDLAACATDATDSKTSSLLEEFPEAIDGVELGALACDGQSWLALHDPTDPMRAATVERAGSFLASHDRTIDDLMVASAHHETAPGQVSTITALRVEGTEASRMAEDAIPLLLGIERPQILNRTAGSSDLELMTVRDETVAGSPATYLYAPLGDTLWAVSGADSELLEAIVTALPGPGGRVAIPELGVAVTFPDDWQVTPGPERVRRVKSMGPGAVEWNVGGGSAPSRGDDSSDGFCVLKAYRPTDLAPSAVFEQLFAGEKLPELEVLDGGLLRVVGPGNFLGGDTDMGFYVTGSGDTVALLMCMSDTAPDDQWMPIAESIEFLAEQN